MVLLSPAELEAYNRDGYVIIPIPSGVELADECLAAAARLQALATPEQVAEIDSKGNHWRLKPLTKSSYWCALDHSLPFLQTCLHHETMELGRQLAGHDEIWLRNAGINELAPGRQAQWHHDGGDEGVEFMHYFNGSRASNGCLRVIPGSHRHPSVLPSAAAQRAAGNPPTVFDDELRVLRAAAGVVNPGGWKDGAPEDVAMPGEVDLELSPHELLVRNTRIFHATHVNRESEARLMNHWGFKTAGAISRASSELAVGRMRFDDCLTPALLASLTAQQKSVLRIGRHYALDPAFEEERTRENGVQWGTLEEVFAGVSSPSARL